MPGTITLDESLLTLSQAARELPGMSGRGLHAATIWRWAQRGIRGIRLETILVGGIRYTSREALERFICATTAAADGVTTPAPIRSTKQREAAIAVAERELAQAGL